MYVYVCVYIYIYIYISMYSAVAEQQTGVCGKITPPEKRIFGKISCQSTRSGGGWELLLLDCMVKARTKIVFFAQTSVWLYKYHTKYGSTMHTRKPKLNE